MLRIVRTAWHRLSAGAFLTSLSGMIVTSACQDATRPGSAGRAHLAIQPTFDARSAGIINIGSVRITLTREDGSVAFDTTVQAETGGTVELSATVELRESPEQLRFDFMAFDGEEQLVYEDRDDPSYTVVPGEIAEIEFALRYAGPGRDAQSVRIRGEEIVVRPDGSVLLEAEATDDQGAVIPGAYFGWRALDPGVTVPNVSEGMVEGGATENQARVVAFLPTVVLAPEPPNGHADTVIVQVRPNQLPSVVIEAPTDGAMFPEGEPVLLQGSATDPEDGVLTGTSLSWRSDREGPLGTGTTFQSNLSLGRHTLSLTATDSEGGASTSAVTFEIVRDPFAAFGSSQQSVSEADEEHTVMVELSSPAAADVSLPFTIEGTATLGEDYVIMPSPLVIAAGETSGSILVTINDDTETEPDETIVISLESADNAEVGSPASHTIVIVDDDVAPIADAGDDRTVTDADGTGAEAVTLDGTGSSDPDGEVVAYEWSEEGATLATGATPTVDLAVGTHTIRLTVTDDDGLTASDQVSVTVLPNEPPIASAGPDRNATDTDLDGTEPVTLDASGSSDEDGVIVSYEWTEGATQLGTGITTTPSFSVGVHTVTLTVTDDGGATATDEVIVTVTQGNQPPTAVAGPDQTISDPDGDGVQPVTLDGSASSDPDGTIETYTWSEGGNQIADGAVPEIILDVGIHTITLAVTDDGGLTATDDVEITVTANQVPTANAGSDQQVTDTDLDGAEQVTVDGSASSDPDGAIVSYVWTEGATELGTGAVITPTFTVGEHNVTLTVTDDGGATSSDQVSVIVAEGNLPPNAEAGPDQTVQDADGSQEEVVTLDGSASSDQDGTITNYQWNEGVTVLASGSDPTPAVSLGVGTHSITLTVTDDDGATDSDNVVVIVEGNVPPTANAGSDQQVTDTDVNGSEPVTLNGSGSVDADGSLVSYVWTEGENTLGTGVSITPSLAVGVHTITLTVTDNGGASDTDQVVVTVEAGTPPTIVLSATDVSLEAQVRGDAVSLDIDITNGGDGTVEGLTARVVSYSPDSCNDGVVNACWLDTELSSTITPATVILVASPTGTHPETGPWEMTPGVRNAVVEISSTTPGVASRLIDVEFVVVGEPGPPELFGVSVNVFEVEDPRCNLFGPERLGTSFDVNFQYEDPDGDVPQTADAIGGSWVFFPSGEQGAISTIHRALVGDGFSGTAETRQCYVFGSDKYVEVTMTLTDAAGNQAALPPIRIDRPSGSN